MLTSFWRQVTLSGVAFDQWRNASILHQLLWPLRKWRQGSWLLPVGDWLGPGHCHGAVCPGSLRFHHADRECSCWRQQGCGVLRDPKPDEAQGGGIYSSSTSWLRVYWGVMVLATALSPVRGAAISGLIKLTLNVLLFLLMARILRH